MESSYHLAKNLFPKYLISKHWDIYPHDFHRDLFDEDKIKSFRSNELSFKLNDSLEKAVLSRTRKVLNQLSKITGKMFIEKNKEIVVGNPKTLQIFDEAYDYHDLFIIYFFHTLYPILSEKDKNAHFFVCEIGGGYGALAHCIKKNFPSAVCLLFDLPEQNYISNYYLRKLNPNAKILNLDALIKIKNINSIDDLEIEKTDLVKYDYVILPGYLIEKIQNSFIDVFINTRSFMEMNIETVNFYFSHIHRAINKSGVLYCVNRYIKKTSGDTIKFKKFPFDEKWSFEISRKSFSQPLIHEALLRRTNFKNYKLKQQLMRLKPYDVNFFKSLLQL